MLHGNVDGGSEIDSHLLTLVCIAVSSRRRPWQMATRLGSTTRCCFAGLLQRFTSLLVNTVFCIASQVVLKSDQASNARLGAKWTAYARSHHSVTDALSPNAYTGVASAQV